MTREICVFPAGAGLDDFEARLSMANVARDGPFSRFAGIDRTLAVLSGRGVELSVGDAPPVILTPATRPFSFPGDAPTQARLLDGPILDLNVMVRRDIHRHSVARIWLDAPRSLSVGRGRCVAFCAEGAVRIETLEGEAILSALDAAVAQPAGTDLRLSPLPSAIVYVVEITDVGLPSPLSPARAPDPR